MRVFRVEHNCGSNDPIDAHLIGYVGHGPNAFGDVKGPWCDHYPDYGSNGPDARQDVGFPDKWYVCGVTAEQYASWWGEYVYEQDVERSSRAGWEIVVYEVPRVAVKIGEAQVVFDCRQAERVNEYPLTLDLISELEKESGLVEV